jgi:adenylate cyclase
MARALAIHNNIMREKINKYKGYEVKTEGDAFMIAFTNPVDACKWCSDVQESLLHLNWPEELLENKASAIEKSKDDKLIWRGLRGKIFCLFFKFFFLRFYYNFKFFTVRMGVHCGEPSAEPDPVTGRMDYFGRMVNRLNFF